MYVLCVCKGLNMLLCSALSMQTKQSINIHAKAYKVIAMQSKTLIYMQRLIKAMQRLYYVYGFT
ncbi:hypothetical protein LS77_011580 [Helicobacter bilis]|uniref:Uncharacterized protein n=2 Tax=Helicobacter bilis TaxID=37372 RepID=N2BFW4_9HELI|nr:hypothetical protein [Helicobacter bilis]EMZ36883.1 hypothetical protein C826_02362 [Helicobacter bilis WiWa]EMZ36982.1 hypothetical protein C826_02304 [Helicobacter bilis WiWa]EMZ37305.1 hypothetical protein C826_02167 [Helicobacter bilis WiWa]TLE00826.1 hypothetical protein LS77_011580 [Helicobacter bilis]